MISGIRELANTRSARLSDLYDCTTTVQPQHAAANLVRTIHRYGYEQILKSLDDLLASG